MVAGDSPISAIRLRFVSFADDPKGCIRLIVRDHHSAAANYLGLNAARIQDRGDQTGHPLDVIVVDKRPPLDTHDPPNYTRTRQLVVGHGSAPRRDRFAVKDPAIDVHRNARRHDDNDQCQESGNKAVWSNKRSQRPP